MEGMALPATEGKDWWKAVLRPTGALRAPVNLRKGSMNESMDLFNWLRNNGFPVEASNVGVVALFASSFSCFRSLG